MYVSEEEVRVAYYIWVDGKNKEGTEIDRKFNGWEKVSKSGLVNCVWRGARELSLTNVYMKAYIGGVKKVEKSQIKFT